ncbi:membrane protein insertase YidC [Janibacter sp. GS2]|uniref:membrane protein insertase YidC n=1 Tax=Janibacter sp. GS2 TaxID=3442646 RepID=UPI003EBFA5B6
MSFSDIIFPFEWLVAWIMYLWHGALTAVGMPEANGWTWTLSIAGLVLVMRAALIPLFVKQIHASRKMQLIQPEMQKIQAKYKDKKDPDSRQKMTEETMALYKDSGTNPFSSCLPILVQMPFFYGLFRVLNSLDEIGSGKAAAIGPITQQVAAQAESSAIFGAPLSAQFMGSDEISVKIVTVVLIILMSATTFTTQYQLMRKNMPASALEGQFAQQQKLMLYLFPIIFAVSGGFFPVGVLIYWFSTNLWTMCQQFYVIRRMPAPGSAAEKAMQQRRQKQGKSADTYEETRERAHDAEMTAELEAKGVISGQRQQPRSKKRAKKSGGGTPNQSGKNS